MIIETKEKLKRYLSHLDVSQTDADKIGGVVRGQTYSYMSGRSDKINDPRDAKAREYLKRLAEHKDIPLDWFYDGKDTWPHGELPSVAEDQIPVVGTLPFAPGDVEMVAGTIPRLIPNLPPDTRYFVCGEDIRPQFVKGDMVLVSPTPRAWSDVIALVSTADGSRELCRTIKTGNVAEYVSLRTGEVVEGASQIGMVVEARRTMANGLVVSYDCHTGVTPEMLAI